MNVYFSGIGGVAIGPLALLAQNVGFTVAGSDLVKNRYTNKIQKAGIEVFIGQTGREIASYHQKKTIDWLVVTAALPSNHPELQFARSKNIKVSKRDEFINYILRERNLKMMAIAGTHGKTNTTGMAIWALKKLGVPVSYSIGTNISFGPSGNYEPDSQWFVYEADEFDKNFLKFKPEASVITTIDYDHPDSYPTQEDYDHAFQEFINASKRSYFWKNDAQKHSIELSQNVGEHARLFPAELNVDTTKLKNQISLPGDYTRMNAVLLLGALQRELHMGEGSSRLLEAINSFPGTERRFERLTDNLYSDYAHHPAEIKAVIQAAKELSDNVVVVYQPHQNKRQHLIQNEYYNCFSGAKKVYWLPTYLSREPNENILEPKDLIAKLDNPDIAKPCEMNEELLGHINEHRQNGDLVLILGAGNVDEWIRSTLSA